MFTVLSSLIADRPHCESHRKRFSEWAKINNAPLRRSALLTLPIFQSGDQPRQHFGDFFQLGVESLVFHWLEQAATVS
jgi:hypothetical protein